MGESEQISGTVESISFYNEENGFTVMCVDIEGKPVTAVGVMPKVAAGESVRLEGIWQIHSSFGRQFKVSGCVSTIPQSVGGMHAYLASGAIKGIRESTAEKIIEKFGEKSFEIIENEPERLSQIKGITLKKAEEISAEFIRQQHLRETMEYLRELGMTPGESMRAYHAFGGCIENRIKEDPYILCNDEIGMSFERVDEMVNHFVSRPHEMIRIMAGIKYILRHNLGNGHSCVPREKVIEPAKNLLECSADDAEIAIDNLISSEEIVEAALNGRYFLFLPEIYDAEKTISQKIKMFCAYPPQSISVSEELMDFAQQKLDITFEQQQRRAIRAALEKGLLILTGGPGTGKTTAIRGIISLMDRQGLNILLTAPTGRAAKRMTEITGIEAQTIHRLLGAQRSADRKLRFEYSAHNPLKADAVIVDEVSMVDVTVFAALLEALPLGCRIIMVGDFDQLPPVGAGNILQDIIEWGGIEVIKLTEIFRQAMQSGIVTNSHRIVKGEMPVYSNRNGDYFMIEQHDPATVRQIVCSLVSERLPKSYQYNPINDLQVLCASKIGECGTVSLNKTLQNILNPKSKRKKEITRAGYILREGDKVMQIHNNYDILWYNSIDNSYGSGVFNGDIGRIESIDFAAGNVNVLFDERIATYPMDQCGDIELAYAVTVHKSQGSEFRGVVMPAAGIPQMLKYRNLLYTAVTRARELLVIVGSTVELKEMIENDKKTKRYSALKYFLEM